MRTVQIYVGDIEIDYVEKTLKIKKENPSFSSSFKIAHSRIPFLVIENKNTIEALGNRDLTSRNKVKVVDVVVIEAGLKFSGELEVLEYLNGFRKVNIKYASKIYPILNEPIKNFMPTISVIAGETEPAEYTEESETIETGYEDWHDWSSGFLNDVFPQTKWQLPTIRHQNRFGVDLEEDDTWYQYKNEINKYDDNLELIINEFSDEINDLSVSNYNVVMPMVFLLTPLLYAFNTIGFKLKGSFPSSSFIRRLLLLPKVNNMTKKAIEPSFVDINYSDNIIWPFIPENGIPYYQVQRLYQINEADDYVLKYRFVFEEWPAPFSFNYHRFQVIYPGSSTTETVFGHQRAVGTGNVVIEGELNFTVDPLFAGSNLAMIFSSTSPSFPLERSLDLRLDNNSVDFYYTHPTIDFSRYVPEWTVAQYLNEIKSLFNVSIDPDDFRQHLNINFNEQIDAQEVPEIISKSLEVKSFEAVANTSFTLKYGNNEDEAIYITKSTNEVLDQQSDSFNEKVENGFKFIPSNNYTAEISEEVIEKDGVGLLIYDTLNRPFISSSYDNKTLKLYGPNGIYEVYWKNWLQFRLNASALELEGPFTNIEIEKIQKAKAIYVDHQRYRIVSLEFSEAVETINMVKFFVESVNH